MFKVLILGGTGEARLLASRLAEDPQLDVIVSLAGRTKEPVSHDVPVISGGFGGVDGLADFLTDNGINLLIDGTHPFAMSISINAAEAAQRLELPAFALKRPPWTKILGDDWIDVHDHRQAISALGEVPRRVFLSIGRQEAVPYFGAGQHFFIVRSVEPVAQIAGHTNVQTVLDRGPFGFDQELKLLRSNSVDVIVTKNSGGEATYAKIAAARTLKLPVVMIGRPAQTHLAAVDSIEAAMEQAHNIRMSAAY